MTKISNGTPDHLIAEAIAHCKLPGKTGIIVLRDQGGQSFHRYVTHWYNEQDGGFYWGHYFADLSEAREDFNARCKRGF